MRGWRRARCVAVRAARGGGTPGLGLERRGKRSAAQVESPARVGQIASFRAHPARLRLATQLAGFASRRALDRWSGRENSIAYR